MEGERFITQADPRTASADARWVGRVVPDPRKRSWAARHVERVIEQMNADLGKVPESAYRIVEGGVET